MLNENQIVISMSIIYHTDNVGNNGLACASWYPVGGGAKSLSPSPPPRM